MLQFLVRKIKRGQRGVRGTFFNSRLSRSQVVHFTQNSIAFVQNWLGSTKSGAISKITSDSDPMFSTIKRKVNKFLSTFSGLEIVSQLENCLVVFDVSCEEILFDKNFSKIATAGRHRNLRVIYLEHNLFQQSNWLRTIDLNPTHIIFFKSPGDIQKITYIRKQLNNANVLKESYELAKKQPFGHIFIYFDLKTLDSLRSCSNFVPPGPPIFYLPSSKAIITFTQ